MLRISWPFALVVALAIAVVARRPRLIIPVAVVLAVWFLVASVRGRRPPE